MQFTNEQFYRIKNMVPMFKDFNNEELLGVLKMGVARTYKSNEKIFEERTRGDCMYIIFRGKVKIVKRLSKELEEVLAMLESGQAFGEMSLIDSMPRSASAIAIEDNTVALEVNRDTLNKNLGVAYKFYKNFSITLSNRLRVTNSKLIEANQEKTKLSSRIKTMFKSVSNESKEMNFCNFKDCDLSGVYLEKINLSSGIFTGAKMESMKMKGNKMNKSIFAGSDISNSIFEGCDFQEADFKNVNFVNTVFKNCIINDPGVKQLATNQEDNN